MENVLYQNHIVLNGFKTLYSDCKSHDDEEIHYNQNPESDW